MNLVIRRARPGDEHAILRLIRALAAYENEPDAVKATPEGLARKLFGPDPRIFAHVAELDGRIVAMAVWFFTFSTWTGKHGLFLEDLFVDPEARGHGIARALFEALAAEAKANDCARIDWSVLGWNELAKGLYRRLGGRHMDAWEPWRIDGEALERLQGR